MPRKKPEGEAPAKPVNPEQRPTRELYRFVAFYNEKIKAHGPSVTAGVIKNIQRLIDKGLGVEDLAQALENYEKDDWRRANPRFSKSIFAFFTYEIIKEWLLPRPKMVKPDPIKARVTEFQPDFRPEPAQPTLLTDEVISDEL
jgi:hypothetical protein